MSKYCPITQRKVLYLECLECEYKNECGTLHPRTEPEKTCGECSHFLGLGNYNLSCTKMYGICNEYTKACYNFNPKLKVK